MPYRDDDGESLAAPTADGQLRAKLAGRHVELVVGERSIAITRDKLGIKIGSKTEHVAVEGALVLARGVPREDLGVWLEVDDRGVPAARRVFGVESISVLEPEGLPALRELELLARRVRGALLEQERDVVHAVELGAGHPLDKVFVADRSVRLDVYTRRLFGGLARRVLEVGRDGHVQLFGAVDEVVLPSPHAITVRGDFLRFADATGVDRVRLGIPWLTPEERDELAARIAKFVTR
jgi:hypothetical protein